MSEPLLTLPRTGDRARCRVPSRSTTNRLTAAWQHSPPFLRRGLIASCALSVALAWSTATGSVATGAALSGVLLAAAAFVDIRERRLPNRLLSAACVAALLAALLPTRVDLLRNALIGASVAGGLVLLVRVTRGIGMGDVKMAGVVGASVATTTHQWRQAPVAIAIAAFAAAAFGAIAHRQRVPLGPSLWLGWATTIALSGTGWLM